MWFVVTCCKFSVQLNLLLADHVTNMDVLLVCVKADVQNAAFRSGDMVALWTAAANLNCAITVAKRAQVQKVQNFFQDLSNTRTMWKGIQPITDTALTSIS